MEQKIKDNIEFLHKMYLLGDLTIKELQFGINYFTKFLKGEDHA
jgi:hypothetical protein